MFKILLALHLLFAIFAIGPLVGAVTTASRGIRQGDGVATASAARTSRVYAYASVLVVPTLDKVTELIGRQESVVTLTARVAAAGGVVGLIFAGIVFLMVYRPGK